MSRDGYLPDGCRESDIPGNSRDDALWEKWYEELTEAELNEMAAEFVLENVGTIKYIVRDDGLMSLEWHLFLNDKFKGVK